MLYEFRLMPYDAVILASLVVAGRLLWVGWKGMCEL